VTNNHTDVDAGIKDAAETLDKILQQYSTKREGYHELFFEICSSILKKCPQHEQII
jgi:hypothetical protein